MFCPLKEILLLCISVRYLIVVLCYFASTKIQTNYCRANFSLILFLNNLPICGLFCNFAPQPDEETGSAEEQPASNMAVPTLEAVFQEPSFAWTAL
jgi:hypothetical protein